MEQEKRSVHSLHHDKETIGEVKIADEVVASIAGVAASEVEGVDSLAESITGEMVGKLGMKHLAKGVKVDVLDTTVSVDLAIIIEGGYSIPDVCAQVQERVQQAIESMTGLNVIDVNIKIIGVNIDKLK